MLLDPFKVQVDMVKTIKKKVTLYVVPNMPVVIIIGGGVRHSIWNRIKIKIKIGGSKIKNK
jgi:predicted TIM-barrel enzyme